MAKLVLTDLANLTNETTAVTAINNNNAAIETAIENTLSRDGTSPNTMGAQLDMNSNAIVNIPELDMNSNKIIDLAEPTNANDAVRLVDLQAIEVSGGVALPNQEGHGAKFLQTDGTVYTWQVPDISELTGLVIGVDIQAYDATYLVDADIGVNVQAYDATYVVDADIGVSVQAHDAVLDATTASFLTADETKLDGIETAADVTDATNVAAAGAVMNTGNETVAGVKTFSSDPLVPDEAYASGWNGSLEPPTKNAVYDKIEAVTTRVLGTPVAATSGTYIDFTSIPSGTKTIKIMLIGVSTNGTSKIIFQLGDVGGIETSGYFGATSHIAVASVGTARFSNGFGINSANAANIIYGTITLTLENSSSFNWTAAGNFGFSNADSIDVVGGSKSLSAELDRVRITTVAGSDAFDAGEINIQYE